MKKLLSIVAAAGLMLALTSTSASADVAKGQKLYLKKLKNIDFTDSKSAAYKLTKYGKILADDESKREIFSKLTDDL